MTSYLSIPAEVSNMGRLSYRKKIRSEAQKWAHPAKPKLHKISRYGIFSNVVYRREFAS